MVLTSKFGGGNASASPQNVGSYLAASLDFMVDPSAANKARLASACVEHAPERAEAVNRYFAKHVIEPAPAAPSAPSVAKKPLSGL